MALFLTRRSLPRKSKHRSCQRALGGTCEQETVASGRAWSEQKDDPGDWPLLWANQDESTWHSNDGLGKMWFFAGTSEAGYNPKGPGLSRMISGTFLEFQGVYRPTEEQLERVNKRRAKEKAAKFKRISMEPLRTTPSAGEPRWTSAEVFDAGSAAGRQGWYGNKEMMRHEEAVLDARGRLSRLVPEKTRRRR